jgi:DNA-binding NarL/FixJ family response regulator
MKGASNADIAVALVVSPFTVKTYVNRAMTKVDARDRSQLVAFAFAAGLRP